MKSNLFLFVGLLCLSLNAQSLNDALRYSQTSLSGSARFSALSGAFGALGGELSAISVNPAASSVFFKKLGKIGKDAIPPIIFKNSLFFNSNFIDLFEF